MSIFQDSLEIGVIDGNLCVSMLLSNFFQFWFFLDPIFNLLLLLLLRHLRPLIWQYRWRSPSPLDFDCLIKDPFVARRTRSSEDIEDRPACPWFCQGSIWMLWFLVGFCCVRNVPKIHYPPCARKVYGGPSRSPDIQISQWYGAVLFIRYEKLGSL